MPPIPTNSATNDGRKISKILYFEPSGICRPIGPIIRQSSPRLSFFILRRSELVISWRPRSHYNEPTLMGVRKRSERVAIRLTHWALRVTLHQRLFTWGINADPLAYIFTERNRASVSCCGHMWCQDIIPFMAHKVLLCFFVSLTFLCSSRGAWFHLFNKAWN